MAFRASLRPVALAARSGIASSVRTTRAFHSTPAALVKVGDGVPYLDVLREGSPANTVNLAEELSAEDGIIIGVPGAFSPGCSQKHIPSYLTHPDLKDAGKVFVVSVNDPFDLSGAINKADDKNFVATIMPPKKKRKTDDRELGGTAQEGAEQADV
ncbi:putative tsa family protein [Diaporthe ampelina]|uniref:Putative tsa family protein n=1 Tax=Diaporthe ampelina TaxID=1214573 RepID=A0A0G2HMD4_9PEZI|nr:putative tsa family protein [Diaporthe ampelina]